MQKPRAKRFRTVNSTCKQLDAKTERRKAERLLIPLKVKYRMRGKAGRHEHIPWEDISGLGLRFCLNKPLSPQKELEIAIYISDDPKPVKAIGKIVWCREFRKGEFKVGVEFTKIENNFRFAELLCKTMLDSSLG
ncbi:MAG: PilZ domain-containing protein [Candidatus Omnitrophica bacterium]|nr:PilZ domain-containing protein [Candidatus Omnitrophota bacterium]